MSTWNNLSLLLTAETGSRPERALYAALAITLPEGVRVLFTPIVQSWMDCNPTPSVTFWRSRS